MIGSEIVRDSDLVYTVFDSDPLFAYYGISRLLKINGLFCKRAL